MLSKWPEKRLTPGRLAYLFFFYPRARFLRAARSGFVRTWRVGRGERRMEAAAAGLPPLAPLDPRDPRTVTLHFLTGRRFWHQTVFCAWTFARHSGRPVRLELLDDGSLLPRHVALCERVFPAAVTTLTREEAETRLDDVLPAGTFPTLRERRLYYPNLRKLTDVHVGREGRRLVLDSDMLFYRRPDFLLDWIDDPAIRPLHMIDHEESYGFPRESMEELCGATLAECLNVGICGLASESIDWVALERWNRALIDRHGTSYFEEQALTAMLMAGRGCAVAPRSDYVCLPDSREGADPRAVMHHFVSDSKPVYFLRAWEVARRRALER